MKTLESLIKQLPRELQEEVIDFIEFLIAKKQKKKKGTKLKQNWAGELEEYRNKYTSLELQKKALEWRGD
ncbi:MAG: hypothetical protein PWP68_509 [Rikenellaceae bacterium]|nr:hypothetical protein [Rikenellaceae bacterium]